MKRLNNDQKKLIEDNIHFVKYRLRKYADRNDFDELLSVGYLGFIEAASRFDQEKHVKFITYANYWITNYVFNYFKSQINLIRIPTYVSSMKRKLLKNNIRINDKDRVKKFLGLSDKKYKILLIQIKVKHINSDLEEKYERKIDLEDIPLRVLNEKEKYIIRERYLSGKKMKDIAIEMNLNRTTACMIYTRALAKLKREMS